MCGSIVWLNVHKIVDEIKLKKSKNWNKIQGSEGIMVDHENLVDAIICICIHKYFVCGKYEMPHC